MTKYCIFLAFLGGTVFVLADAAWMMMMNGGIV
jgi:hypothetical protein